MIYSVEYYYEVDRWVTESVIFDMNDPIPLFAPRMSHDNYIGVAVVIKSESPMAAIVLAAEEIKRKFPKISFGSKKKIFK